MIDLKRLRAELMDKQYDNSDIAKVKHDRDDARRDRLELLDRLEAAERRDQCSLCGQNINSALHSAGRAAEDGFCPGLRSELETLRTALAEVTKAATKAEAALEGWKASTLDAAEATLGAIVYPCHICGSIDAVRSDRAELCSKGHAIPVQRAVLEQARFAIEQLALCLERIRQGRPRDRYAAQLRLSEEALALLATALP